MTLLFVLFPFTAFAGGLGASLYGGGYSLPGDVIEYTVYITDNTTDFNGVTYASVTHYSGTEDTFLSYVVQANNYGASELMYVGISESTYGYYNTLVRFTGLINIPAEATVTSVEIGFYQDDWNSGAETFHYMHRCLRDWVEGNSSTDGANYTEYDHALSLTWSAAGGFSNSADRSDTNTGTFSVDLSAKWKVIDSDTYPQLITDVQNFVSGTWTNNGWIFYTDDTTTTNFNRWRSSEYATDGRRPYLKVVYEN